MTLAWVYVTHGEALEADLLSIWGVDINECSLRRMRNLFERLPSTSEVHYDIEEVPRESRAWNINTYMMANLVDAIQAMDWHLIAINSKRPPRPPKPINRPKLKKEPEKPKGYWPGRTIIDKGVTNGSG